MRALPAPRRFVQTSASVEDLLRFSQETRFVVLGQREVGPEALPTALQAASPPGRWIELDLLRFARDETRPLARLGAYGRPVRTSCG